MKKLIVLGMGGVVALGALVVVVVVYKANDILSALKPTLETRISDAVGVPVSVGEISLSFFSQQVVATELKVGVGKVASEKDEQRAADSPPSPAHTLQVGTVSARANLGALLSGRLEVTELLIERLGATAVRSKDGIRILGLPAQKTSASSQTDRPAEASPSVQGKTTESSTSGPTGSTISLSLQKLSFRDSAITLLDETLGKAISLTTISTEMSVSFDGERLSIGDLDARTTVFAAELQGASSPTQLGALRLAVSESTLIPSSQTLTCKGGVLSLPAGAVAFSGEVSNGKGSFNIAGEKLSLAALGTLAAPFAPALDTYSIGGAVSFSTSIGLNLAQEPLYSVSGPLTLIGIHATVSPEMKVEDVTGEIEISATPNRYSALTKNLSLSVKGEKLTSGFLAVLEGKKFTVDNLVFSGLGEPSSVGKGEGNSMLTLNESLDFASQLKARDLSIGTLSRIAKPELASLITGTILTFENEILGELRAIPASLRAHGDVTIINGSLKGFNLPGLVLKKVEGIPLVPGSLFSRVPPNYQSVFAQPDTPIKSLKVTYGLSGLDVMVKGMTLESDVFTLTGKGTMAHSGELSMDATIAFTPEFSAALVSSAKDLKKILAADGRLTIPLTIAGHPPLVVVVPNLREVISLAAERVVTDKAKDILNKALGKNFGF